MPSSGHSSSSQSSSSSRSVVAAPVGVGTPLSEFVSVAVSVGDKQQKMNRTKKSAAQQENVRWIGSDCVVENWIRILPLPCSLVGLRDGPTKGLNKDHEVCEIHAAVIVQVIKGVRAVERPCEGDKIGQANLIVTVEICFGIRIDNDSCS